MSKKLDKKDMGSKKSSGDFTDRPQQTGKTSLRPKPVKKHNTRK